MKLNVYVAVFTEKLSGRKYESIICAESKPIVKQLLDKDWMGKRLKIHRINKVPYKRMILWLDEA